MQLMEGERELILSTVEEVLQNSSRKREDLIPCLQKVQSRLGYLPALAMEKLAEGLAVPAVDIYGIATFYNQFRLNPPGKYQVKVCLGTACYMKGGDITLESFERRMAIKEGETSPDRLYSLERVACVGCCTLAPVVVVNEDHIEGYVSPTRVDGMMLEFEEAEKKGKGEEAAEEKEEPAAEGGEDK